MTAFVTSARGAFRTALSAGAVVLTVAVAGIATTAPAEAFVRHGGGFHRGGFHPFGGFHRGGFHRFGGFGGARFGGHRFGYGFGRPFGGYGFRRVVGYRTFGPRRFAYRVGLPFYGYGYRYRVCPIGRHFVPGLGCRLNAVYGFRTFGYGYRPYAHGVTYGVRRVVGPAFGYGYGVHRFGSGHGRHFGGYGGGFRHAGFGGFGHGGIRHGGFGHGGGFRHTGSGGHGGHVRHR